MVKENIATYFMLHLERNPWNQMEWIENQETHEFKRLMGSESFLVLIMNRNMLTMKDFKSLYGSYSVYQNKAL